MNLAVDHAAVLWGLPLALLPLWRSPFVAADYSWNVLLPADTASRWIDWAVRLAGVLAMAALLLGMAGLHRREYSVERTGQGAHVVLLLDRSRSMDDSFAGRMPGGGEESKSAAAERLLTQFVSQRKNDLIGVAAFSTSPLFVLPLTDNRDAVLAAVRALKLPALAQTHVGKGLAMALSYFQGKDLTGSRVVLLVSDGAAALDADGQAKLRRWLVENQVRLYWVFLRTAGTPGLFEPPETPADDNPQVRPEYFLNQFFASLGTPYRAYEAENPGAMEKAMADIGQLENLPVRYREKVPRQDFAGACYLAAAVAIGALLAAKGLEYRR
jgi:mxaC protein